MGVNEPPFQLAGYTLGLLCLGQVDLVMEIPALGTGR